MRVGHTDKVYILIYIYIFIFVFIFIFIFINIYVWALHYFALLVTMIKLFVVDIIILL